MKKILHINSNYAYSALHSQMIAGLEELEINNTIFFPVRMGLSFSEEKTGTVLTVPCFRKWDRLLFYGKQRKMRKALEERIELKDYGLIHTYTLFTDGNLAYSLWRKYGIPYVVAVRNTDVNYFLKYRKYLTGRGREILMGASAVFFLSPEYKKQVLERFFSGEEKQKIEEKVHIIPNGIHDFWHENPAVEERIPEPGRIKLIYAGRINKDKNILQTAKAAEMLYKKGWQMEFTVVGKVEDEQVFESLNSYDFVRCIEVKPREELIKLYREHDIFVMPSRRETFGLVYPEAMSQGLPVIYTKGQGFDGQFPDGEVGYSVDSQDENEIVEKILKIVDNYKEISRRAVQGAGRFKWKNICLEYKGIYEKILSK